MLINSVVLILREVLEAALLISVLLSLSAYLRSGMQWFIWSAPIGVLGVILYASNLDSVTDALDGAGQEVVNAALQIMVYLFCVGVLWCAARGGSASPALNILMGAALACAVAREGSEIMVYISGFGAMEEYRSAVYTGSAIGAGIGLSMGVLLFNALVTWKSNTALTVILYLVGLIGAGMVMQATMLLEQVDWLASGKPLWDSSSLINEQSVTGELLYAALGYEATPSAIQGLLYILSIAISVAAYGISRAIYRGNYFDKTL